MAEKINNLNDKKEELACILLADAAVKKGKLEGTKNIYQDYIKGKLKYPYDAKSISKVANFISETSSFKGLFIPSIVNNNSESDFTIKDREIIIVPGKKIETEAEYISLVKFLISTSNNLNSGDSRNILLLNQPERKKFLNAKIDELFELWSKVFFDFFLKCYDELSLERERILNYYTSFESFFENPTDDKYRDLVSKISYIRSVSDSEVKKEIKTLLKDYKSLISARTNKKEEQKNEVLVTREEKIAAYDSKNCKAYTDLEAIELTKEQEDTLNEIYEFVCSLDREDFKEFAANPLEFFSHIDESYRDCVINNFIVMMEKDDFKMKQTIAKRLINRR